VDGVGGQGEQVHRVPVEGALLVEAGQQEEVLDQAAHAGRLVLDPPHQAVELGRVARPVHVGQHHVQHDQVGPVPPHRPQRLQPAGGRGHLEPGQAQAGREQLEDVGLVLDHQQPGLRPRLAHARHSPCSATRRCHPGLGSLATA
jgi:hypothetical protein